MKKLFVIILLLILGGCSNGIKDKEANKNETIVKEGEKLKFVVAPQYEGKTSGINRVWKEIN